LNKDCVLITLVVELLPVCLDGAGFEGTLDMNLSISVVKSILGIVVRSPLLLRTLDLDSGEDYFLDRVEFTTIYDSSLFWLGLELESGKLRGLFEDFWFLLVIRIFSFDDSLFILFLIWLISSLQNGPLLLSKPKYVDDLKLLSSLSSILFVDDLIL